MHALVGPECEQAETHRQQLVGAGTWRRTVPRGWSCRPGRGVPRAARCRRRPVPARSRREAVRCRRGASVRSGSALRDTAPAAVDRSRTRRVRCRRGDQVVVLGGCVVDRDLERDAAVLKSLVADLQRHAPRLVSEPRNLDLRRSEFAGHGEPVPLSVGRRSGDEPAASCRCDDIDAFGDEATKRRRAVTSPSTHARLMTTLSSSSQWSVPGSTRPGQEAAGCVAEPCRGPGRSHGSRGPRG